MKRTLVVAATVGSVMAFAPSATANTNNCKTAPARGDVTDSCRERGWTIKGRLVVTPHGVVIRSDLPSCRFEDGSGTDELCTWNFPHHHDGDGVGLAYWVHGPQRHITYVWTETPQSPRWRWVSSELADALAEGSSPGASSRDWERCVVHNTTVRCPDGLTERS